MKIKSEWILFYLSLVLDAGATVTVLVVLPVLGIISFKEGHYIEGFVTFSVIVLYYRSTIWIALKTTIKGKDD